MYVYIANMDIQCKFKVLYCFLVKIFVLEHGNANSKMLFEQETCVCTVKKESGILVLGSISTPIYAIQWNSGVQ